MRSLVIQLVSFRKYGLSVKYLQVPILLGFLIYGDINSFKKFYKSNPLTNCPSLSLTCSTNFWRHVGFNRMEWLFVPSGGTGNIDECQLGVIDGADALSTGAARKQNGFCSAKVLDKQLQCFLGQGKERHPNFHLALLMWGLPFLIKLACRVIPSLVSSHCQSEMSPRKMPKITQFSDIESYRILFSP